MSTLPTEDQLKRQAKFKAAELDQAWPSRDNAAYGAVYAAHLEALKVDRESLRLLLANERVDAYSAKGTTAHIALLKNRLGITD